MGLGGAHIHKLVSVEKSGREPLKDIAGESHLRLLCVYEDGMVDCAEGIGKAQKNQELELIFICGQKGIVSNA